MGFFDYLKDKAEQSPILDKLGYLRGYGMLTSEKEKLSRIPSGAPGAVPGITENMTDDERDRLTSGYLFGRNATRDAPFLGRAIMSGIDALHAPFDPETQKYARQGMEAGLSEEGPTSVEEEEPSFFKKMLYKQLGWR